MTPPETNTVQNEHRVDLKVQSQEPSNIWDESRFMTRIKHKPERALRLINAFLDQVPEEFSSLMVSIEREEFTEASMMAHTIKGVTANVSADTVSEDMREAEQYCKGNSTTGVILDTARYQKNFEFLVFRLEAFREKLSHKKT